MLIAAPKLPDLSLSIIETLFEPKFAAAMSGLPSELKSPVATEKGFVPTARFTAAAKLGVVPCTVEVIVTMYDWLPLQPLASVVVIVKLKLPDVVGVPDSTPVEESTSP